ncbi:MAG: hypothetical protein QXT31_03965 [Candidatus Bathyarchaeia archaeon]
MDYLNLILMVVKKLFELIVKLLSFFPSSTRPFAFLAILSSLLFSLAAIGSKFFLILTIALWSITILLLLKVWSVF